MTVPALLTVALCRLISVPLGVVVMLEPVGMTICEPAPLVVSVTEPALALIAPTVNVEPAACGLIVTLEPAALTCPINAPGPTTETALNRVSRY